MKTLFLLTFVTFLGMTTIAKSEVEGLGDSSGLALITSKLRRVLSANPNGEVRIEVDLSRTGAFVEPPFSSILEKLKWEEKQHRMISADLNDYILTLKAAGKVKYYFQPVGGFFAYEIVLSVPAVYELADWIAENPMDYCRVTQITKPVGAGPGI